MRIAVVGLGAVGGWIAARLAAQAPGVEVSALARGATLEAVREHGLRFTGSDGKQSAVAIRTSADVAALGGHDLVVVAVKAPALPAVTAAAAALCAPDGAVLTAMNGVPWWFFDGLPGRCRGLRLGCVDPGESVRNALPSDRVLGAVVHLSCVTPEPGVVRHVAGDGLIVGEALGGPSARLARIGGMLSGAGFQVTASERIQRDIWFKLWGNMTMNPVSALTGATGDRILDDPLVRAFCSAVMEEARVIGAAFGIPIEQDAEQRHAVTRRLGAFRTSMLQDVEAGRPVELDALVGAVQEIGRHLGLATPNIDALFGLARLMARTRGLYPDVPTPGP